MKKKTTTLLVGVASVVAVAIGISGCTQQRDLEGVQLSEPDKVEHYANIDEHPNITRLCIDGVAFATTTREYTSVLRIPEWDAWCNE